MTELDEMLRLLSSRDAQYDKKKLQNFFTSNYSPALESIILKINSPIIFERFTNIMQSIMDIGVIDEKRDNFTKKILLNEIDIDKETFSFFHEINPYNYMDYWFTDTELEDLKKGIKKNKFEEVLNKIASKWLDEYIIYYFLHENYYNYLVNLNQILRYLRRTTIDLIDEDHLSFYLACYNLPKLSFKEKVQFFKDNYEKKDIQSMFYDDMRIVKNHSYQGLVNSLLKVDKANNLYNEELSKEKGVPVYYLDGEKFNALVRYFSNNGKQSKEEYERYIYSKQKRYYYSFSYISDKNAVAIGFNSGYVLLYDNINPDLIAHVYHGDSGTYLAVKNEYFKIDVINEIHTPETLVMDTDSYNEIVIKKDEKGIKPSALVCYDEIDDNKLSFAKEHHLPIVLINSKKYRLNTEDPEFDDDNTYSI